MGRGKQSDGERKEEKRKEKRRRRRRRRRRKEKGEGKGGAVAGGRGGLAWPLATVRASLFWVCTERGRESGGKREREKREREGFKRERVLEIEKDERECVRRGF